MRNTTLHSRRGRRPSGTVWIADPVQQPHAFRGRRREQRRSIVVTASKGGDSRTTKSRRGSRRLLPAGCRRSGPTAVRGVPPLDRNHMRSREASRFGSYHERDWCAAHAQAFARGIRYSTMSRDV